MDISDKTLKTSSFANVKAKRNGQRRMDVVSLYSEDEEDSVTSSTNVSSVGLHVLPPSPISCTSSISSSEGTKNRKS